MSSTKNVGIPPSILAERKVESVLQKDVKETPVTFGELRASLPFADTALPPLCAEPLPFDGLPQVVFPK